MFDVLAAGDWAPHQIAVNWTHSTRRLVPEVERAIEQAWAEASRRLGKKLFDGPMCRLEKWSASPRRLELTLSRTSYRPFLGTNLFNAHLADAHGREALANPVGLSTALQTSDGYLLLGRRNDQVAYYPNRVHPFAGALEPAEPLDVFAEIRRELREELHLDAADIGDIRCIGVVEDRALRQPELIFHARTPLSRSRIKGQLDPAEHRDVYSMPATATGLSDALREPLLTPIAAATIALSARILGTHSADAMV